MEDPMIQKVREAGDELRARHGEDEIVRLIEEIEGMESDSAAKTADILRLMAEGTEKAA